MSQHLRGILALVVVTIVWGTTFPAMKDLTVHLSAAWIVFVRFAIASVLLLPFLVRGSRRDIVNGAVLGLLLYLCYAFQVEGLARTSSNRNAFITGLNCVFVPLIGVFLGRGVEKRIVLALALSVLGLAALCWDGGRWTFGDTLSLACAFSYGVYIRMMATRTQQATSLMTLTAAQIVTVCVCAAVWLLLHEVPRTAVDLPNDYHDYWEYVGRSLAQHWLNFAWLGVICTAAIISLQSWGQRHTTANEAAVMYAFEPGAAAVFGYFWINETLTARGWVGAALLISGMIVSQWNTESRPAASLAPE